MDLRLCKGLTHLIGVLRPHALINVPANLQHPQTIGSQHLKHGLLVGFVVVAPHELGLVYAMGVGIMSASTYTLVRTVCESGYPRCHDIWGA